MADVRLGISTPGGLAAGFESARQHSIHHEAAQKQITKASRKVSMAKHPATTESRSKEFAASASAHLSNAQEYADKAKYHKSQSDKSINAQYGGTAQGRSENFEAGRANAAYN